MKEEDWRNMNLLCAVKVLCSVSSGDTFEGAKQRWRCCGPRSTGGHRVYRVGLHLMVLIV